MARVLGCKAIFQSSASLSPKPPLVYHYGEPLVYFYDEPLGYHYGEPLVFKEICQYSVQPTLTRSTWLNDPTRYESCIEMCLVRPDPMHGDAWRSTPADPWRWGWCALTQPMHRGTWRSTPAGPRGWCALTQPMHRGTWRSTPAGPRGWCALAHSCHMFTCALMASRCGWLNLCRLCISAYDASRRPWPTAAMCSPAP